MNAAEKYFAGVTARGELSHAYLLEMPAGELRTRTARNIAARILCENGNGCGECAACRAVASFNHPDVITISHEKPNVISVAEIRSQLVDDIAIRPYRSAHKIYLVEDADKLNPQGQNAILKTLEEPPAYGVIFLISDNRNAFLPTVLSRLIVVSGGEEEAEDSADGTETLKTFLHRLEGMSIAETSGMASALKSAGLPPEEAVRMLRSFWRDLLVVKAGAANELNDPEEAVLYHSWAGLLSDRDLEELWQQLALTDRRLKANVNPDNTFEVFFLRLKDALRAGRDRVIDR